MKTPYDEPRNWFQDWPDWKLELAEHEARWQFIEDYCESEGLDIETAKVGDFLK